MLEKASPEQAEKVDKLSVVQEKAGIVVHLRLDVNFGPILEIGKVRENLVLETL